MTLGNMLRYCSSPVLSYYIHLYILFIMPIRQNYGVQWLSGTVLDSRPRGQGFKPHWHHCIVSLIKKINPSLVLVQPRKICPFITERLLMGRKESNQTKTNKSDKLNS